MADREQYLVTKTETIRVYARDEQAALTVAGEGLAFFGPDTVDIQVEKLDDHGPRVV